MFQPQSVLTRAQLARAMVRCRNLKPPAIAAKFSDVSATDAIEPDIAAGVAAGVVVPKSATAFGPGDPVKRAELATSLVRAFGLTDTAPSSAAPAASDIATLDTASAKNVTAVVHASYMGLDAAKAFNPGASVTRADAAQALYAAIAADLK